MITAVTKNTHQISQLFLNVNLMLILITTALALPLRVPLALNALRLARKTLVMLKGNVMKPICGG